jgi:hypothetical protein
MEPFEWLSFDRRHRRRSLIDCRMAIRNGQLDGPQHAERRQQLIAALARLADEPGLSPREGVQLALVYAEMGWSDLGMSGGRGVEGRRSNRP